IVESRLDALLVARYVGDLVGVMAQGSNSANPCQEAMPLLDASPYILYAMDYDTAGLSALKKWKRRFETLKFWPAPEGGDPGEYVKDHNGDIRAWVSAGLPPGLRIIRKKEQPEQLPLYKKEEESAQKQPLYISIESKCGRLIYITGHRETRIKLEGEKKIVFSRQEMKHVTDFQNDGGSPSLLVDIKEIFGGGQIKGRKEL
ncbi:hypothetical protein KA005_68000, partial [bacterium]|nr:hypothetical protein [bacterium]